MRIAGKGAVHLKVPGWFVSVTLDNHARRKDKKDKNRFIREEMAHTGAGKQFQMAVGGLHAMLPIS